MKLAKRQASVLSVNFSEKEHAITNEIEGRRMIVQEEREAVFGRLDESHCRH
jgi:hypothetical protein